MVNVGQGGANLVLSIGVPIATKAGWFVTEAGTAAGGLALAAGAAAGGSVALVAETARAAIHGQKTPIQVADEYYSEAITRALPIGYGFAMHVNDIAGLVKGSYATQDAINRLNLQTVVAAPIPAGSRTPERPFMGKPISCIK